MIFGHLKTASSRQDNPETILGDVLEISCGRRIGTDIYKTSLKILI